MGKTALALTPTVALYDAAFEAERAHVYPMIDAFEARAGFALDRERLEGAARVLACPLKAHGPNWQHGRVLYAATRWYLQLSRPWVNALDIGTAKGFSSLCLYWGIADSGCQGTVTSLDVLDPRMRERRNTVAEVDGLKTLEEILNPWPEATAITFVRSTGQAWLTGHTDRTHIAFVDGKHSYEAVSWEASLLAARQESGDLAIFDDVQIAGVAKALGEVRAYEFEYLDISPIRRYAIGRRK